jgi:hypothetical protein
MSKVVLNLMSYVVELGIFFAAAAGLAMLVLAFK